MPGSVKLMANWSGWLARSKKSNRACHPPIEDDDDDEDEDEDEDDRLARASEPLSFANLVTHGVKWPYGPMRR